MVVSSPPLLLSPVAYSPVGGAFSFIPSASCQLSVGIVSVMRAALTVRVASPGPLLHGGSGRCLWPETRLLP
jgi:hypothetical protein